jgi:hypothetical protein
MENLGPFETQKNSEWFKNMYDVSVNDFGYHEYTWSQRALMALEVSGCQGNDMTAMEIHDAVAPYVGSHNIRGAVANMAMMGKKRGILLHTGERRRQQNSRKSDITYDVIGHMIPTAKLFRGLPVPDVVIMEDPWL